MAAMTSYENTQFITGDYFQPRPQGFCLPFFKGKVLDTRLNCASAAHTAEKLSCTPIAHELRKEEKKMCLVSLDDLRFRRSVRNFNLPRGIPRAFNYFGCSRSAEFGGIVPQSGEMKRPVKVSSFEPWVAGENKVRECFWRLTRGN